MSISAQQNNMNQTVAITKAAFTDLSSDAGVELAKVLKGLKRGQHRAVFTPELIQEIVEFVHTYIDLELLNASPHSIYQSGMTVEEFVSKLQHIETFKKAKSFDRWMKELVGNLGFAGECGGFSIDAHPQFKGSRAHYLRTHKRRFLQNRLKKMVGKTNFYAILLESDQLESMITMLEGLNVYLLDIERQKNNSAMTVVCSPDVEFRQMAWTQLRTMLDGNLELQTKLDENDDKFTVCFIGGVCHMVVHLKSVGKADDVISIHESGLYDLVIQVAEILKTQYTDLIIAGDFNVPLLSEVSTHLQGISTEHEKVWPIKEDITPEENTTFRWVYNWVKSFFVKKTTINDGMNRAIYDPKTVKGKVRSPFPHINLQALIGKYYTIPRAYGTDQFFATRNIEILSTELDCGKGAHMPYIGPQADGSEDFLSDHGELTVNYKFKGQISTCIVFNVLSDCCSDVTSFQKGLTIPQQEKAVETLYELMFKTYQSIEPIPEE